MALTTDQKINLLILAGFEPMCHGSTKSIGGQCAFPRIHNRRTMLWGNFSNHHYELAWRVEPKGATFGDLRGVSWEELLVDTIPDDLIYLAINPEN